MKIDWQYDKQFNQHYCFTDKYRDEQAIIEKYSKSFSLNYEGRKIGIFRKLESAKLVAELLTNG